jgi:drug/metabolite transporter (DMT)-like permease
MSDEDSDITMERKRLLNRNNSAETMHEESDIESPPPSSGNHLLRHHNNSTRDARYHHHHHPATTSSILLARIKSLFHSQQSIKLLVLIVLSLQNSLFTVLRRYSQGIRREEYSKYEVLMMGEIIKLLFSAYMIRRALIVEAPSRSTEVDAVPLVNEPRSHGARDHVLFQRLLYLIRHSGKMMGLALIYGIMNILSFVALRNIGAGMFTIFAQCKILTTAAFSALILQRQYSWTQWRALLTLSLGVLLFSEPIWNRANAMVVAENFMAAVGVLAVSIEVTLSGFASIYFEKVIKLDPLPLTIWERNFQLALVRCIGAIPPHECILVLALTCRPLLCITSLIRNNIGKRSSLYLLYRLGRGWYGRLVRRLVAASLGRHYPGGGRWFARRPIHQVW